MSRRDDFFDDKPPSDQAQRVMSKVESALAENRSRQKSRRQALWFGFGGLATAASALVAILWGRQTLRSQAPEAELLVWSQQADSLTSEDLELLATMSEDDWELLQEMDNEPLEEGS